jgi:predicted nucleotidyltransferase
MNEFEILLERLRAAGVQFVIVGGVAAVVHGSARLTNDLDVVYARTPENVRRLVTALAPLEPYLRGAPPGLPFRLDEQTVKKGLNFTLTTTQGPIDLLGEMAGVGGYTELEGRTVEIDFFGATYRCVDLATLIVAKRAAGRPKDYEVVAELESMVDEKKNR